jgi:hypothetical protein
MVLLERKRLVMLLLYSGYLFGQGLLVFAQETAKTETVEVVGTAAISRDDVAKARDEGIAQGLWDVVEKGVELLIPPAAVVSNFQTLSDHVYSRPEEFIIDYKVLTESKSGRSYRVVVQATLSTEALKARLKDLGVLASRTEPPKVLILLSEQNVGAMPRRSWAQDPLTRLPLATEDALASGMTEKGFVVVNPGLLSAGPTTSVSEYPGAGLTDDMAIAMAQQAGADIVIVGSAVARLSGNTGNADMQSVEAILSVRALKVQDGLVIGSFETRQAAIHADEMVAGVEAFTMAAASATAQLGEEIATTGGGETSRQMVVELVVQGIGEYNDFVNFRKVLTTQVKGVRNVYLKAIKAGEARMDVELQGNAQTLADKLLLKTFGQFGVNILDVGQSEIRLELVPKPNTIATPGKQ